MPRDPHSIDFPSKVCSFVRLSQLGFAGSKTMALAFFGRVLIPKPSLSSSSFFTSRFICTTTSLSVSELALVSPSPLLRLLRPLIALSEFHRVSSAVGLRSFSSSPPTTSSLNVPSPNLNNRPPKETILNDGFDFWLIIMDKPEGDPTTDELIDVYIKTLAMVLGSEEEAKKNIYSVSTDHYFAFGATLVSKEVAYKINRLKKVRWVLPHSYLDGDHWRSQYFVYLFHLKGEPFINGQVVPYDSKHFGEWVRNIGRANEKSRRNKTFMNFGTTNFISFCSWRNIIQSREMPNGGGIEGPPPNMGGAQGPPPNTQGEPFIYGQVVPSNPKYHEEPVRELYRSKDLDLSLYFDPPRNFGSKRYPPNMRGAQGPPPNTQGSTPMIMGGQGEGMKIGESSGSSTEQERLSYVEALKKSNGELKKDKGKQIMVEDQNQQPAKTSFSAMEHDNEPLLGLEEEIVMAPQSSIPKHT